MYTKHSIFNLPKDENTKIWKYLDLTKFLSLIENEALYFCRSDMLDDPFEGTVPLKSLELINEFFKDFENKEEAALTMKRLINFSRKLTLVNCWHINNSQSDAMWRIYSKDGFGLAIQSTIRNLKDSFQLFKEPIYVGKIKYIDFSTDMLESLNGLEPYIYKRKSFEHENELRAVLWSAHSNVNIDDMEIDKAYPIDILDHGKYVEVDVNILIECIYISPTAPSWYTGLIEKILKRYNFNKKVFQSDLYKIPDSIERLDDNGDRKENSILINKEALEYFYKKDAQRLAIEKEAQDRLIKRQYDSVLYSYEEIKNYINKLEYKSIDNIIYKSEQAILEYSNDFINSENPKQMLRLDFLQNLFFLVGQFDKLFEEISSTILIEEEKKILFKKLFYLYTPNLAKPLIQMLLICKKNKINEEIINILGFTFDKFLKFINDNKI